MKPSSVVRYTVTLLLLALVTTQIDFSLLKKKAFDFDWTLIGVATLLVIVQTLALAFRWHLLINAGQQSIKFSETLLINMAGHFANVFLISTVGGVVAKSAIVMKKGIQPSHTLFSVFLDRLMTLGTLIVLSALSLPFLPLGFDSAETTNFLIFMLCTAAVVIALSLWALISGFLERLIRSYPKVTGFLKSLRDFMRNIPLLFASVGLSLLSQTLFIAMVVTLSLGLPHNAAPFEIAVLIPLIALVSSLPISIGGWGVRESAFVFALGFLGFSNESAFLLSVQVGIVTVLVPFIVGLPYLLDKNFKLSEFLNTEKL